MQIRIVSAKGKKDRYTLLSEKALKILREYYRAHRPIEWVFEGTSGESPYSSRSIQQILKASVTKAGITKPVTMHTLHHLFATHLLDGRNKVYLGVPGNLVAFACKISFHRGFEGYVSFTAKTQLIGHYEKTLGAINVSGHYSLIYRFCSSVPDSAVWLPSVHGSLQTTLLP